MSIKLVKPNETLSESYRDYVMEWNQVDEKIVPYAARPRGMNYQELLGDWSVNETKEVYKLGFVPSSLYFLIDSSLRIIGALHLRHELNDSLTQIGGHIGYGIRPSERGNGYATKMLKLGLEIAKQHELREVLLTCDDDNIASYKTIELNGGVLKDIIEVKGVFVRRYTITIE